MKDKLKKILSKPILLYLIINLIYILISSFLALHQYISTKIFSYGYIVLLIINIVLILILFFKKKYVKNKIDIFLLLIIFFAIISTIFAYNPNKALFGEFDRNEGLFVICYYITILFLTSFIKKEDRKYLVYSILIFGIIQCLYAIAQKLDLFGAYTKIVHGYRWATGFTSNRNMFAVLMLLCTSYCIGLLFKENNKYVIALYFLLIYVFSIGLFLSKSLGSLLGLIIIVLVSLIFVIKNGYIKRFIVLLVILIFNIIFLDCVHLTAYFHDINEAKTDVVEMANGISSDSHATGRIHLWKETIKIVPNYLLHGVGIDNFFYVNNGLPIKSGNLKSAYDKAHNEYLQILVTMGIFSLISYLCLHFIIIKNGIINAIKNKEIYLVLPVVGYLVQAQFNISVIEVAPLFYISLGLLVDRKYKSSNYKYKM